MTFYFFSISFMFSFSQEDGDPGLVAFICSGLGEMKESDYMHPSVFNDFMAGIFCIFPIKKCVVFKQYLQYTTKVIVLP